MSITRVAQAAGVSTATVSRVLNDFPGVSHETVRRVRAAMAALNYQPQRTRLRRPGTRIPLEPHQPRTGNIAVVTVGQARHWLQMPIMASVLGSIQVAAGQFGYRIVLDEILNPNDPGRSLDHRQLDGAILFITGVDNRTERTHFHAIKALGDRLPVVWTQGVDVVATARIDHVTADNVGIGQLAQEYLQSLGKCTNPAFVALSPAWPIIRLRGQAFLNACRDDGCPATSYLITEDSMLAEAYGPRVVMCSSNEQLVQALAGAAPRHDGVFIANDHMTALLHPMLVHTPGLHPQRDIALISCDNEETRLSALQPRPVSIDVDPTQLGYQSIIQLMWRMRNPHAPPVLIHVTPRIPPQSAS